MPKIAYPECGKIVNTHGCHGEVKVEPWCDSPAVFAALPRVFVREGDRFSPVRLARTAVFREFVFARLEGVDTMEAAETWRGRVLYAAREDLGLPQGAVLVAELVGLPVLDADTGEKLGVVRDVIHPAAQDIYVVDTPRGEALVPAVPAFIRKTDAEQGVFVTPIGGMFP